MTALPPISSMTAGTVNEGVFKANLGLMRECLAGLLGEDGTVATALATLGGHAGRNQVQATGLTLTAADRGNVLLGSGTWTLTLPAVAAAGAGWSATLVNSGTGTITLDGAGSETVNGSATLAVPAGWSALILCSGTAWTAILQPVITPAANKLPYLGTAGALALADLTPAARALLDDADAATMRATLGIGDPLPLTDFTASLQNGWYYYSESTATGAPGTGAAYGGVAFVSRYLSGAIGALAMRLTTAAANQRVWFGVRTGDTGAITWTDLVGESGSNANGEYVRFPTGTQICRQYITSSASAELTWTFPAAFVSTAYRPAALPNFSAAENRAPRVTNKMTTSLDVSVFNTSNARVATGLEMMAIGRWF